MEQTLEGLKNNWKRYLVSSCVTFVATFLLVAVPQLLDDNFQWTGATIAGVFLAAIRLGVKAVWEISKPLILELLKK